MTNLAIIPVKASSKRLASKNLRSFHGKPLFYYAVENALNSGLFDEVHVSTESQDVVSMCEELRVKPLFLRPKELADEFATINQVCSSVINKYEALGKSFDNFCILWATAPLNTSNDIVSAYSMLKGETEGVVAVTQYDLPVFCAQYIDENCNLVPVFPDMLRKPSSILPQVVCDNGAFCWVKINAFKEQNTWLPNRLKGYNMPKMRSVDIDTQDDWDWSSYLFQRIQKEKMEYS